MPRPAPRVALVCLGLAFGAAGCGGGDDSLSSAEYVKQADALCQEYTDRQSKLGDPKSVKDVERLGAQTKPLVEELLTKLRALKAPKELATDVNAAYRSLEQQLPKVDELVAAAKANDLGRIEAIAGSAGKLNAEANAKFKKVGLKVCGEG